MEDGHRRYQIYLSNEGGPPIDVYVVSPYSDGPVSSEDWVSQPIPPASPLPMLQVIFVYYLIVVCQLTAISCRILSDYLHHIP